MQKGIDAPDSESVLEFGRLLRELREGQGWTQYDVPGLHRGTIAAWESGARRPSRASLRQVSAVFSVPLKILQMAAGSDAHSQTPQIHARALREKVKVLAEMPEVTPEIFGMIRRIQQDAYAMGDGGLLREIGQWLDRWVPGMPVNRLAAYMVASTMPVETTLDLAAEAFRVGDWLASYFLWDTAKLSIGETSTWYGRFAQGFAGVFGALGYCDAAAQWHWNAAVWTAARGDRWRSTLHHGDHLAALVSAGAIDTGRWAESWAMFVDSAPRWPDDPWLRDRRLTLAIAQAVHRAQWTEAEILWEQAEALITDDEAVAELWGWHAVMAAQASGGPEVLEPLWHHLDQHPHMALPTRLECLRRAYALSTVHGWDLAWPLLWILRQAYYRYHASGWLRRHPWPTDAHPGNFSVVARMVPWIEISTSGPEA